MRSMDTVYIKLLVEPPCIPLSVAMHLCRLDSDDLLAHTISVLEAFKEASSAIGAVPFLPVVIGSALSLISTLERIKGDKERCMRLKRRVINLLMDIKESIEKHLEAIDSNLVSRLAVLQSTLTSIQAELEELAKRGALARFLRQGSIRAKLDEHIDTVDEAACSFNRAFLTALAESAIQQANFNKDQLRLIRSCDVEFLRLHGTWRCSDIIGEQLDAHWNGRAVAIRRLPVDRSTEDVLKSIIWGIRTWWASLPLTNKHLYAYDRFSEYPHVARLLGRSHPSEAHKFLILERGKVDAEQYFASNVHPTEKLRCFLQMTIDYEHLFQYLRSSQFPVARIGELHMHDDDCLSSLAIKDNGTFVVLAEHLDFANLNCLSHRLDSLFRAPNSNDQIDGSPDFTSHPASRSLLSIVNSEVRGSLAIDTTAYLRSSKSGFLPAIWSCGGFQEFPESHVGDYGYIQPDTHQFVRLGSAFDVLQQEPPFHWIEVNFTNGASDTMNYGYIWREKALRHVPQSGGVEVTVIDQQIRQSFLARFWWICAFAVAERNKIPLRELRLLRSKRYWWSIRADESIDDYSHTGPSELFFHQSRLTENGEVPSPFGYWSLDESSGIVPRREVSVPGIQLECGRSVMYSYLSGFQTELNYSNVQTGNPNNDGELSDEVSEIDDEGYEIADEGDGH
ncbi:hypothetical protein OBBRIDRAFT_826333 [Obba rivulosa]|uniref:Uncharacterized protein n=1 Tax=Obba rivulosa TaxID=1052685 RepID=A0A8E2DNG2_9APHY|nr:hypothetical protein OBBRIDRAFT_826333 [Obba rivulosa]